MNEIYWDIDTDWLTHIDGLVQNCSISSANTGDAAVLH